MKMEEELELALQRVVNEKQYKYIPQLEHILTLAQQKERILATQILADKELHCPLVSEGEADEGDEEHLRIDGMEKALLNHKIVKTTLQSAAFSMQIGETVKDIMQQTDVEETVDQFPERGVLLSHSSNNLHTCKELASVMEQKNNHEKEILELQTKYLSHLTVLREKWESLQDRVKQREGETSTHGNLQKKMKEREDKIQLLITMIQGLITSSSFQWGASNYYLQVMLLCDAVTRKLDTVKQKEIMKEISMIHEEREDKENKSGLRQTLITESIKKKE